jgi:hypothetical protein
MVVAGDAFSVEIAVTEDGVAGGAPVAITALRHVIGRGSSVLIEGFVTILDGPGGRANVTFDLAGVPPGAYRHEAKAFTAAGVQTVLRGAFVVEPSLIGATVEGHVGVLDAALLTAGRGY